jgi:hypothetical protein
MTITGVITRQQVEAHIVDVITREGNDSCGSGNDECG